MLCATSAFAGIGPIEMFVEAPYHNVSPLTDGVITEGEYNSTYFYSFVDLENPGNPYPPLNQMCGAAGIECNDEINIPGDADLSATVHYGHDDENLYIGFDVIDTFLNEDEGDAPWNNDGVELFIDADADGADARNWSLEGFQLVADTIDPMVRPPEGYGLIWEEGGDPGTFFTASTVLEGVGYTIEFQIPLASLDIEDGPGETAASTGSLLRSNFAINDVDIEFGTQSDATHGMQWFVEDDPRSPFGGAEEVWVVGIALTEAPPGLEGDINMDGHVDAGDLNIIGINWQTSGKTPEEGDLTGDGVVDAADLNILALNWQTWAGGAAAAVPEPSTLWLAIVCGLLTLGFRRRKLASK
jgi:hypothetical protein